VIAAVVALAVVVAGLAAAVVAFALKALSKTEGQAKADVAGAGKDAEIERLRGDNRALRTEADEAHAQGEQLAEELQRAITSHPVGAGLAADDVAGRLRAFREAAARRAARRDPVPNPVLPQG
jgi:hypothetical protein